MFQFSLDINSGFGVWGLGFGVWVDAALAQASKGKGATRHSTGQDFRDQPIMTITRTHGVGFPMGQAAKKIQEAARMDPPAARQELLGAIVYLAAAWIAMGDDT